MKRVFLILTILLLLIPLLSACWNQKELTELAFVMALGIDKDKDKKFKISFQLVNPGNVISGQLGSGGSKGLPIAVYQSTGDTMTQAVRNATKKIPRRLYYAHTNLVVVSEEVARKDMEYILDALDRDPEFRVTAEMIVARGCTAEDIVSALTLLDKIPVEKVTKQLKTSEKMLGENMSQGVDKFLSGLMEKGRQPFLNGYILKGDKSKVRKTENLQETTPSATLISSGLAVFHGTRFRGWIEPDTSRGIIWIQDKLVSTYININWKQKKNAIVVVPSASKTKISVKLVKEKPVINIRVVGEGWISEANSPIDLSNPKTISEIEKLVEKEINRELLVSIKASQKLKCDILGFGRKIHISNPQLWKKLEKNWDNEFATLKVNTDVDFYVRREGVRTQPFWSSYPKAR